MSDEQAQQQQRGDGGAAGGQVAPGRDQGSVRVLGLVGAALLTQFEQLAADAHHGPTIDDTLELTRHASARFATLDGVLARLTDLAATAQVALGGYTRAFTEFHLHSPARSWDDVLLKTVLVCGFARDVEVLVAERLDPGLRPVFSAVVAESEPLAWWATQALQQRINDEPALVSTLGLYGRRVLAEATAQAQRVSAQHGDLAAQLTGTVPGSVDELSAIVQLIADLVEASAQRMTGLGLQP